MDKTSTATQSQRSAIGKLLDLLIKHGTLPNAPTPEYITNAQAELATNEMIISTQAARISELEKENKRLLEQLRNKPLPSSIQEALNSGDGVYRP